MKLAKLEFLSLNIKAYNAGRLVRQASGPIIRLVIKFFGCRQYTLCDFLADRSFLLNTLDTVPLETPDAFATSSMVAIEENLAYLLPVQSDFCSLIPHIIKPV